MNIRDFKDKYVFLKDIFDKIKKNIKVKGGKRDRQLSYKEYRKNIKKRSGIFSNSNWPRCCCFKRIIKGKYSKSLFTSFKKKN